MEQGKTNIEKAAEPKRKSTFKKGLRKHNKLGFYRLMQSKKKKPVDSKKPE